jgi:hypothetical protein
MREPREVGAKGWRVREELVETPDGEVVTALRFLAPGNLGLMQIPADAVLAAADLVNENRSAARNTSETCWACDGAGVLPAKGET